MQFLGRRDVYTGLVPKVLALGGILGGGKSQLIPVKPVVKVVHGAAQILSLRMVFFGILVAVLPPTFTLSCPLEVEIGESPND